ncbi:MAG: CobD/CbiB family protein [Thauera sp.]|nr:MAG: CobD/CbiB family protein [Thauera sp.]
MTWLSLFVALLIEQYKPLSYERVVAGPLARYAAWFEQRLNAGEARHGVVAWSLAVGLPVAAVWFLYLFLVWINPVLGWVLNVIVLYVTMGFRQFSHHFEATGDALRAGDTDTARRELGNWLSRNTDRMKQEEIARLAIEQGLLAAHRHVFAPLALFALLPGPTGPLLYRLTERLSWSWARRENIEFGAFGRFARNMYEWLDFIPVRMTAATFAIVGDFEDAVHCWRTQAAKWPEQAAGILLASGGGALGVKLGAPLFELGEVADRPELGMGDDADVDLMQSAIGLVWRTLIFCLLLLGLLTLAGYVGS